VGGGRGRQTGHFARAAIVSPTNSLCAYLGDVSGSRSFLHDAQCPRFNDQGPRSTVRFEEV
jgi:hypothetical protein